MESVRKKYERYRKDTNQNETLKDLLGKGKISREELEEAISLLPVIRGILSSDFAESK